MKHFKNIIGLLFFATLFVSCEKESIITTEEKEMKLEEKKAPLSFYDLLNSGLDVQDYVKKRSKNSNTSNSLYKSVEIGEDCLRYDDLDEFNNECSNLPTEDFEVFVLCESFFFGTVNSDTNNGVLAPGDILPGVNISNDFDSFYLVDLRCFVDPNSSNVLFMDLSAQLHIEFNSPDVVVKNVGMSLYAASINLPTSDVRIEVFGADNVQLCTDTFSTDIFGAFWGVKTEQPITRLTLYDINHEAAIGLDDLAFGTCSTDLDGDGVNDDVDNCPEDANADQANYDGDLEGDICDADDDNDGCLDEVDPVQFSNLEATVDIDGCDSGVENRVTSICGYTMSDLIDDLEAGTYKNHGAFIRTVAKLTKSWVDEGLISQLEKDAIMSCAGGASIP